MFRPHVSQKLLQYFISLSCNSLQRRKYKIFEIKQGIISINQVIKILFRYLAKIIKRHIERTSIGKKIWNVFFELSVFSFSGKKAFPKSASSARNCLCWCMCRLNGNTLIRCVHLLESLLSFHGIIPRWKVSSAASCSRQGSCWTRTGWSGLYPAGSFTFPGLEAAQPLWATCSTASLSLWWQSISLYSVWILLS